MPPPPHDRRLTLMLVQIFFFRGEPAADVPLRLVRVQDSAGRRREGGINLEETFRDILMYRAFTDTVLLGRLAHSRIVFYNILCDFHGSFFDIIFHVKPLHSLFLQSMQESPSLFTVSHDLLFRVKNKESGLPDSRAGARLRQQPFSLGAKCASPGGFYAIRIEVSHDMKKEPPIGGFFPPSSPVPAPGA